MDQNRSVALNLAYEAVKFSTGGDTGDVARITAVAQVFLDFLNGAPLSAAPAETPTGA